MNCLVERVSEYMQEHHMVENGQKVVVGVSGGADSMGLLSILSEIAEYFHISLVVVHVNHGIRGKQPMRTRLMWKTFVEITRSHVTVFMWI